MSRKLQPQYPETQAAWYQANKDLTMERARNSNYQRFYGITTAEYEAMVLVSCGTCYLCGELEPGKRRLSVDHDHITGRVRGLLCNDCNRFVGGIERKPQVLEKLQAYLHT